MPAAASRVAGHVSGGIPMHFGDVIDHLPESHVAIVRHEGRGSSPYSHCNPSRAHALPEAGASLEHAGPASVTTSGMPESVVSVGVEVTEPPHPTKLRATQTTQG